MRKNIILLAILLLSLGCISQKTEEPETKVENITISEIIEHLEEYIDKEVQITGTSRGSPILIGETAYADIADGTGRSVIKFNPKEFFEMIEAKHGDKITVIGLVRTDKSPNSETGEILSHGGVPFLIEPIEIHVVSEE